MLFLRRRLAMGRGSTAAHGLYLIYVPGVRQLVNLGADLAVLSIGGLGLTSGDLQVWPLFVDATKYYPPCAVVLFTVCAHSRPCVEWYCPLYAHIAVLACDAYSEYVSDSHPTARCTPRFSNIRPICTCSRWTATPSKRFKTCHH